MAVSHILTVDVEEYFQAEGFENIVPAAEWDSLPSRVERTVDQILAFLDRYGATATFFVNTWVADSHPSLVRAITREGHEAAAQGSRCREMEVLPGLDQFREEVRRSKELLESITGRSLLGFRSPDLSLPARGEEVFDTLIDAGYYYDSSLFPTGRTASQYKDASPDPHLIRREDGTILELPLTTLEVLGVRLPAEGGANFRQLPFAYTERAVKRRAERGQPAVFRIRSWEVDRFQPTLPTSPIRRIRHYWGLGRTLPRLERLVSKFGFTSVERYFHLPYRDWDQADGPAIGGDGAPPPLRKKRRNEG